MTAAATKTGAIKRRRRRSVYSLTIASALLAATLAADIAGAVDVTNEVLIVADDGAAFDYLGDSVAVSADGQTVVVGATGDSAAAYVLRATGDGDYEEVTKLEPADGGPGDDESFAFRVAVSADGTVVAVGASTADDNGENSGSVYIYRQSNTGEYEQASKLSPDDAVAQELFGESLALAADGQTLVVGARGEWTDTGRVVVFHSVDGRFEQSATISPADLSSDDAFGSAVGVSGDGSTIIASAVNQDDREGAVYVFTADGLGQISQRARLKASDARRNEGFGAVVAISADASTIAVRADDRNVFGPAGAVYVFGADGGGAFLEQDKLGFGEASYDGFGQSLGLSSDGSTMLIGAGRHDELSRDAGAAFVFRRVAAGEYTADPILTASDGWSGDRYGTAVALSNDGQTAIIGSPRHDDRTATKPSTGAVYVFGPFAFPTEAELVPPPEPRPADDQVFRIYAAIFNRPPDPEGFGYWTAQYRGGVPLIEIVESFSTSREFINQYGTNPSDEFLVETMYRNVLNRDGDPPGVGHWVSQLRLGMTVSELLLAFAESPENIANTNTAPPLTSAEARILRMYRAVFGRAPDDQGFAFWVDQNANGQTMVGIAESFARSPEFQSRYGTSPTDQALIDGLYLNVLDRSGDEGGIEFWLGRRSDGMSIAELLIAFADSPENLERTGTQP